MAEWPDAGIQPAMKRIIMSLILPIYFGAAAEPSPLNPPRRALPYVT